MYVEEFNHLNEGSVFIIENKRYELISVLWDVQRMDGGEYIDVLELGLHRENSLTITPREHLFWYPKKHLLVFAEQDIKIKLAPKDIVVERKKW